MDPKDGYGGDRHNRGHITEQNICTYNDTKLQGFSG